MRRFAAAALAAAALLAVAAPARAQSFPSKPVRIVVGFAAGGGSDTATRLFAAKLTEIWNQQILVDNRGGAGGVLAAELVARAAPDGYTLLNCGISHVLRMLLYKNLTFDAVKDFAPISPIATFANVLMVHPSSPFRTLGEFLAYARANPGKLHYGSSGVGGSIHFTTELFKSMAGIDLVHVPYKGGGPAFADLLAEQIDVMFDNTTTATGPLRAGQVRPLGISSPTRWPSLPDLPTISEAGVPGYNILPFYGLCAPAHVPEPILDKLNADTVQALNSPDLKQRFADQGIIAAPMTRAEYTAFLDNELATWSRVMKEANITAD
ncbi:MAG: tripartite tricarboxylate transporter substrate binding protein [Proteobacteria bacterium]|nr:tripartite tricarboxylate transporter substrate binding protein [Pseudomonadota bacterium]